MNFFQRIIVPLRDRERDYAAKIRQNMTDEERAEYNDLAIGSELATANKNIIAAIEDRALIRFEKSGERSPLSPKEAARFWSRNA